uniref:Regulatory protein zeste n=1 Tax=Globodera rostochiensis TaxID=31243 RepID=A0A914GTQ6_GLORO
MALFNKEMSIELARLVDEHKNDLFPEKGRAQSHQVSVKAWQAITDHISAQFPKSSVTVKQVKELGEESSSASLETPKFREKVSRPPSRASNLEDLQRSVLEIELENAKKISQILLRIPSILDKIGPTYEGVEESFIVESEKLFRNL